MEKGGLDSWVDESREALDNGKWTGIYLSDVSGIMVLNKWTD